MNKKTYKIVLPLIVLIGFLFCIYIYNTGTNNTELYKSDKMGISFSYPEEWSIGFEEELYESLHTEDGTISITISGNEIGINNYDELILFCENEFSNAYSEQEILVQHDKINGIECVSSEYKMEHRDREILSKTYFIINEEKEIVIYLILANESGVDFNFNDIINSVKVY